VERSDNQERERERKRERKKEMKKERENKETTIKEDQAGTMVINFSATAK